MLMLICSYKIIIELLITWIYNYIKFYLNDVRKYIDLVNLKIYEHFQYKNI